MTDRLSSSAFQDFAEHQRTTKLSFDLPHQLALLRSTRPIPEREAVAIFRTFATEVRTFDQVVEVGRLAPLAQDVACRQS